MALIESLITGFIISLLIAFMRKDNDKDKEYLNNSDIIVLDCKKNVKTVMTLVGWFAIIFFPALSLITIIKDDTDAIELIVMSTFFLLAGSYLLIGMKYQKIIYKNGSFVKKNILGKNKIYSFNDVVRAKYKSNNAIETIILYTNENKKLEINSYLTNFDWVLKEIKKRNIEIHN